MRTSNEEKERLLLDTTYLLPAFGIGIELKDYERSFPRILDEYSVSYNPVSLVETKWIVLRQARENPDSRGALFHAYRTGLDVLAAEARLGQTVLTDGNVEEIADDLLMEGKIRDYFDRIIYSTAAGLRCALLTEDEQLHHEDTRMKVTPRPKRTVQWKDVLKIL